MMSRYSRAMVLGLALLVALLALGSGVAARSSKAPVVDVVTVPSTPTVALPVLAVEEVSILSIDVSVNVPGDEEWSAAYGPNWGPTCNTAIEDADNAMYSNFDINLYVSTYQDWDSADNKTDICSLLDEAVSERGRNGKKLMIAFTRQVQNCGCSYVGDRYSICADSWAEAQICQHEVSHNYGASHSTCAGDNCVIADCVGHYGQWCNTCWNNIWNNRNTK